MRAPAGKKWCRPGNEARSDLANIKGFLPVQCLSEERPPAPVLTFISNLRKLMLCGCALRACFMVSCSEAFGSSLDSVFSIC